jgi:hypothetical protein
MGTAMRIRIKHRKYHRILLTLLTWACATVACGTDDVADNERQRTINVVVHVEAWDIGPISNYYLCVSSGGAKQCAFTNENGDAYYSLNVDRDVDSLYITRADRDREDLPKAQKIEQMKLSQLINNNYYYPYFQAKFPYNQKHAGAYRLALNDRQNAYTVVFSAGELVNLTGSIRMPDDYMEKQRPEAYVIARLDNNRRHICGIMAAGNLSESFRFKVPKSKVKQLLIMYPYEVYVFDVEAADGDYNMGSLEVDPHFIDYPRLMTLPHAVGTTKSMQHISINSTVSLENLRNNPDIDPGTALRATLLATDGGRILRWPVSELLTREVKAQQVGHRGIWPRIPYGDYYVVPGPLRNLYPHHLAILDALRTKPETVTEIGLPLITIGPDEAEVVVPYDSQSIMASIEKWMSEQNATDEEDSPVDDSPEQEVLEPERSQN